MNNVNLSIKKLVLTFKINIFTQNHLLWIRINLTEERLL